MSTLKLEHGHYCYMILEDSKDMNGYIPVLVIENESGYYPMSGQGKYASPWYWGKTLEEAEKVAKVVNGELGLTDERVTEIITSSMRLSNQRYGL